MEKFDLNSYLKGKTETTELIKDQLEFTLKCGNVSELDIKRMIKLCDSLIEAYKIKTMKTIELECRECNGQGYNEVFVGCNKPASMCCGGCDARITCEECDRAGIIEVKANDDDMVKMIDLLQYFYKNNTQHHSKLIDTLERELLACN